MFGLERTLNFSIMKLLEDLIPSITGTEVEPKKGKLRSGIGEGNFGKGKIETAGMCKAEFVKRDGGARIGSDLSVPNLAEGGWGGENEEKSNEKQMVERKIG